MSRDVYYVAHPVSYKPEIGAHWTVKSNISCARKWMRWFIQHDRSHVYIAPWITEVEQWVKGKLKIEYTDALEDDKEVVKRCDGLIMVGGLITPGMDEERLCAVQHSLNVIDLTNMREPPVPNSSVNLHHVLLKTLLGGIK